MLIYIHQDSIFNIGVLNMANLSKNIKRLRISLGMTQDELADLVGYTSRSSINKIETGQNDIPQSKVEKFAHALGVTPAHLLGWNDGDSPDAYIDERIIASLNKNLPVKKFVLQILELDVEQQEKIAHIGQFMIENEEQGKL